MDIHKNARLTLAGGPAFDPAAIANTVGAPSLRCLQGRVATLPTHNCGPAQNPIAYAFVVPALCRVRKGRGTLRVFGVSQITG